MVLCMDLGSFTSLRLWYNQRDVDGNRGDAGIGKRLRTDNGLIAFTAPCYLFKPAWITN